MGTQHDKGVERFFEQILQAIEQKIRFDVVKVVLVASPGFVREQFLKWLWETATRRHLKWLLAQRPNFVAVHSSSGHKHALQEVLASPEVAARLSDTKYAVETQLLEQF